MGYMISIGESKSEKLKDLLKLFIFIPAIAVFLYYVIVIMPILPFPLDILSIIGAFYLLYFLEN
mgnify:CR=1 FL=1